ncbi:hypothetical protein TB2_035229 [Malus domestica]
MEGGRASVIPNFQAKRGRHPPRFRFARSCRRRTPLRTPSSTPELELNATKMPSSKSLVQNLFRGIWERVHEWHGNSAKGWPMIGIQGARQAQAPAMSEPFVTYPPPCSFFVLSFHISTSIAAKTGAICICLQWDGAG